MPQFLDDHFLIVSPGSQTTLAQVGLAESLKPPAIQLPTKVFRHTSGAPGKFSMTGKEEDAIYPIVKGGISNVPALCYLIKSIVKSAIKTYNLHSLTPLLLVTSPRWSRVDLEKITQYVFEAMKIPAFSTLPSSLGTAFAHGMNQTVCVVDVGFQTTCVTPIVDFSPVEHATVVLDVGGDLINTELQRLLPHLSSEQIEDLKWSEIYEVLTPEDAQNSFFGRSGLATTEKDDGVVDVAQIVASGKERDFIAAKEREKAEKAKRGAVEEPKSNAELEKNTFTDSQGQEIEIGKERFQGCEKLLENVAQGIFRAIGKIDELNLREEAWEGLIIVGRGASVKGFKEALVVKLQEKYLITRQTTFSELPSQFNTSGHNTPRPGDAGVTPLYGGPVNGAAPAGHGQAPTSVKVGRMPEYFPEWKAYGYDDAAFLGAQIGAKQIFNGNIENMFIGRSDYNEMGPAVIWNI